MQDMIAKDQVGNFTNRSRAVKELVSRYPPSRIHFKSALLKLINGQHFNPDSFQEELSAILNAMRTRKNIRASLVLQDLAQLRLSSSYLRRIATGTGLCKLEEMLGGVDPQKFPLLEYSFDMSSISGSLSEAVKTSMTQAMARTSPARLKVSVDWKRANFAGDINKTCKNLADVLVTVSWLTELSFKLERTVFNDDGCSALSLLIEYATNLTHLSLDINWTSVGERGIASLSRAISNSPLKELHLYLSNLQLYSKCRTERPCRCN
eukprot:TRINITY_DN5079_c0_g1_i5.p1 TRINITY_DN5079_c0_g1~~TRINITY_DN5079_c0_g1_i5.p1  ORF type:complete len:265 (-),score=20.74 TRINITY_DN5079_c0_g1_i5:590-1384(-)